MGLNYREELRDSIATKKSGRKKDDVGSICFELFKSVNKHLNLWLSAGAVPLPRGSFRKLELMFWLSQCLGGNTGTQWEGARERSWLATSGTVLHNRELPHLLPNFLVSRSYR